MRLLQVGSKPIVAARVLVLISAVIGFVTAVASAQSVAGKPQPDRLPFGTVRTGAIVEGEVRVSVDGDATSGMTVKVDPPPFVSVAGVQLVNDKQLGNTSVYCDVSISIDTRYLGKQDGSLRIQTGLQTVAIPVSATGQPKQAGLTRVLVVESPFHRFSTDDATLFEPWLALVDSAKLDPSYVLVTRGKPVLRDLDLSSFDVILLSGDGLYSILESDKRRLKQFVEQGGRVVVAASASVIPSIERANSLLADYGLSFVDTDSDARRSLEVEPRWILGRPLTQNVRSLRFYRPSPIIVTDPAKGTILVIAAPFTKLGYVVVGTHGKGEAVALGTSLWWNWIAGPQAKDVDNAKLLENLLSKRVDQE